MASEFRRRTLLTWSVIGAAGYGLKRSSRSDEERAQVSAEELGKKWHRHPINAFAVSPDGRFIATGSRSGSDSLSDESEGVVLWNVDEAAPVWRVPLAGGVTRVDAPFSALTFSPDGSKLGARTRHNEVAVIDVATAAVVGHHGLWALEPSPRFFFSQNAEQLFVAATRPAGSIGNIVDARGSIGGRPVPFDAADAIPFRLDGRGLHVVTGGEYRIFALEVPPVTVATLLPGAPPVVAVDVSRRHLAVTSAGQIATVDLETGQTLRGEGSTADAVLLSLRGVPLGFDHLGGGWHAYHYSIGLDQSLLFSSYDVATELMADAMPGALSPDGSYALELLGTSEVMTWSVRSEPKMLGSPGRFNGARGVAWPQDNRAVVFGPQMLAFVDPIGRTALAHFGFPRS